MEGNKEFQAPAQRDEVYGGSRKTPEQVEREIKRILELHILIDFMNGKRIKQMCKPLKMTARQVEDTLRNGLRRSVVEAQKNQGE